MLPRRANFSNRASGYSLSQRTAATKTAEQLRNSPKQLPLQSQITIKLIGDLKENIHDIVSRLRCTEQSREEIEYIFNLYGKKIDKLREERNFYRDMLIIKQDDHQRTVLQLKSKIDRLEEEIQERNKVQPICERCTCFDQREAFTQKSSEAFRGYQFDEIGPSTNRFRQQYLPHFNKQSAIEINSQQSSVFKQEPFMQKIESRQEELLIENDSHNCSSILKQRRINTNQTNQKEKLKNQTENSDKTLTEEQLFKLMLKYNFSVEELENVLEEYENEHKMAYELFDSEQQRNLYRLGQKMQKQLWNKKVLHDVKRLSLIKNQPLSACQKGVKG